MTARFAALAAVALFLAPMGARRRHQVCLAAIGESDRDRLKSGQPDP